MGSSCCKNRGAKKLLKLNIRTFNQEKVQPLDGLNEIPLWEQKYESYGIKQLAKECKRLQTEINDRLNRIQKVDQSLKEKYFSNKEIQQKITIAEEHYAKINETSNKLIKHLKRQTTFLKENHTYETNKEK